jgi:hypothetical protein
MTLQEFKEKHIELFKNLRKRGRQSKLLLLPVLLAALVFCCIYIWRTNAGADEKSKLDQTSLKIIDVTASFIILASFALAKPEPFAFPTENLMLKIRYKEDFRRVITGIYPEIEQYNPGKKISAIDFYYSGIFPTPFEDYNGDDWMKVRSGELLFDMCELRVTRLFKTIFTGLFIICRESSKARELRLDSGKEGFRRKSLEYFSHDTCHLINEYTASSNCNVHIVQQKNVIYIAIERSLNLFERKDLRALETLEEQLKIFDNNFLMAKGILKDLG